MTIRRSASFSFENHRETVSPTIPRVAISSVDEFKKLLVLAEPGNGRKFSVVWAAGDFREKDRVIVEFGGRRILAEVRGTTEAGPEIWGVRVLNGKH